MRPPTNFSTVISFGSSPSSTVISFGSSPSLLPVSPPRSMFSSSNVRCGECQDQLPASWRCLDCDLRLCPACSAHHKRSRAGFGHVIEQLDKQSLRAHCTPGRGRQWVDPEALSPARAADSKPIVWERISSARSARKAKWRPVTPQNKLPSPPILTAPAPPKSNASLAHSFPSMAHGVDAAAPKPKVCLKHPGARHIPG